MTEPPSKKLKSSPEKKSKTTPTASQIPAFFKEIKGVMIENGLGKTRAGILGQKLDKHGGKYQTKLDDSTTHVFVAQTVRYERVAKLLGIGEQSLPKSVTIVKADWISKCLAEGRLVSIEGYTVTSPQSTEKIDSTKKDKYEDGSGNDIKIHPIIDSSVATVTKAVATNPSINTSMKDEEDSDYVDSGSESDNNEPITSKCSPDKTKGVWVCAAPSTSQGSNHNQHITDKLQVLATSYTNTKDQWRAMGYKKAISSIKSYHKRIETWEECSKLHFVGEKLAKKIWEIVETGYLRRLDHIDPKMEAINLFTDVWGAGPKTAEVWVSKGYRTLEDLEKNANLTSQQKIGLKHFEEFRERMPNEEAGRIGEEVKRAVKEVNSGLVCETCGSYRRRKPTCGDVDVLVSHPDGKSHQGVLPQILHNLKDKGFITDDLVSIHLEQNKYMGVCKLQGENTKHRRLDVILVPYSQYACAIMYFTGSDYFNRSMRLLAKKNGMSLSEHSLNTGVVRHGGEKVFEGTPLPVNSEKDIFRYLGLDYRIPEERDW